MKFALSLGELSLFWIVIPVLLFAGSPFQTGVVLNVIGNVLVLLPLGLSIYSFLVVYYWSGRFPTVTFRPEKLVLSGPYRFIRQPYNAGYIFFLLGLVLLSGNFRTFVGWLIVTVLVFLYARFQERLNSRELEGYSNYTEKVPFLIPAPGKKIPFDYTEAVPWQFIIASLVVKLVMLLILPSRVKNLKVLREGRTVVLALAHQTHFDGPLVFYSTWRYFRFVGTAIYVSRLKIMQLFGTIPVKRYSVDATAVKQMLSTVRRGVSLSIAPEAARSWDGKPLHIKEEIWKLFRLLRMPVVPIKFYGVQRLWPRWANIFSPGTATVEFGPIIEADDPELVEKVTAFLSKRDPTFALPYKNYRRIGRLLWRCPECGKIFSIKGRWRYFECVSCGKRWDRPSVKEVIELHEKIKPGNMALSFPIEDSVFFEGKRVKARIMEDSAQIGDYTLEYEDIKNSSVEKNVEPVFGLGSEAISFTTDNGALMWQEVIDFQIKFRLGRKDYHTELWG